jgi:hypothetical protein
MRVFWLSACTDTSARCYPLIWPTSYPGLLSHVDTSLAVVPIRS